MFIIVVKGDKKVNANLKALVVMAVCIGKTRHQDEDHKEEQSNVLGTP
jgi:hypothetical protein